MFGTLAERAAQLRRQNRERVAAVVESVQAGDLAAFAAAINRAVHEPGLVTVLRAVARMVEPPAATFRRDFRDFWVREGGYLRDAVRDDLTLIDALRVLLPAYKGGPLRLYRGESADSRRRRQYGLSWTRRVSTAEAFASEEWRIGGGVLLETDAPSEAVICSIKNSNAASEDEVLIDRRKLGLVRVLRRVPRGQSC